MSTEDSGVVDKQPQTFTKSDDYGAVQSQPPLKTVSEDGLPKGFSALEKLNKIEVVQRLDTLEVCLGWTRNNRYCLYNEEDEQIFYVYEASVCFNRQVTGALRSLALKMSLSDYDQEDVLLMQRPGACSSRCCWVCCNLQHMELALPSGTVLASVDEVWSCCVPQYRVTDGSGQYLCQVRGSVCHCRCCCQLNFQFVGQAGEEMASITRSCQGCKELIGAANRFTIDFADNLTAEQKLIILGCSFLVDLNYFEKQNKCW